MHVFVSNTGSKPEQALFSRTIDLTQVLGDGTHAGFTGGTGALSNAQDIISWTFDASDAPVSADTTVAVPAFDMSAGYSEFSDVSGLTLNGDAARVGDVLRLTPAAKAQAGSAFLDTAFAIGGATSFRTEFTFRLGGGDGDAGADGLAFVLHGAPAGAAALGEPGGSLAYDNGEYGVEGTAIVNSIAIEFDTYRGPGDPDGNHVGLLINGDVTTHLDFASPAFDLNGGKSVTAWVDYDGAGDLLEVFVSDGGDRPATALFSETIDLSLVVGDSAHAGFAGATGDLANAQDIESWTIEVAQSDFFA